MQIHPIIHANIMITYKITNAETIMQLWKLRACEVTNAINRHNRTRIQMQKLTHL